MTSHSRPCVVGTWPFAQAPVKKAMEILGQQGSLIDAIESGLNVAEVDPSYGKYCVGCGGWQNAHGRLELDAALMDGENLSFGAVTALTGFTRPVSVARRVLEASRHNMLTAEGAVKFARANGFEECIGPMGAKWEPKDDKELGSTKGHDTLGILALNDTKNVCAGVTTSGMANKEAGRVGDSALPGCGLYADSAAGAACCSGDGDQILKFCPCFRIVEYLKEGYSPQEACEKLMETVSRRCKQSNPFEMVVIALDTQGRIGAANLGVHSWSDIGTGKNYDGFPYVIMREGDAYPQVMCIKPWSPEKVKG